MRSKILLAIFAILSVSIIAISFTPVLAQGNLKDENMFGFTSSTGSLYTAGQDLVIKDMVNGNLVAAGAKIIVENRVEQSVLAAGGEILINGDIQHDLVVAGGSVIINGDVSGDLIVAAGEVFINSKLINGDIKISSGKVSISEDTKINGEQSIVMDRDRPNLERNLRALNNPRDFNEYQSPWSGFTSFDFSNRTSPLPSEGFGVFSLLFVCLTIFFIIGSIIAGVIVIKLFPSFSEKTFKAMSSNYLQNIGIGFISIFLSALLGFFLVFTIIGIPILGVLAALALVAYILADIYSKYMIAKITLNSLLKIKTKNVILIFTVGYLSIAIIGWILNLIPFIGGIINSLINTILISWAFGAIISNKYKARKNIS